MEVFWLDLSFTTSKTAQTYQIYSLIVESCLSALLSQQFTGMLRYLFLHSNISQPLGFYWHCWGERARLPTPFTSEWRPVLKTALKFRYKHEHWKQLLSWIMNENIFACDFGFQQLQMNFWVFKFRSVQVWSRHTSTLSFIFWYKHL